MGEFARPHEADQSMDFDPDKLKELTEKNQEHHEREAAKAEAQKPSIEVIQERIERAQAERDKAQQEQSHQESNASESPLAVGRSYGIHASKQTLKRAQKELSKPEQTFSRVVHQPAVQAVSNAAEGTIARPSGLLAGAVCSIVSSLAVLYICRHYGYEYNFLIGLACFAGGFTLGIVAEGIYRLVRMFFVKP